MTEGVRAREAHRPRADGGSAPLAELIEDRGERILRIALALTTVLVLCAIVGGHLSGQDEPNRMAIRYATAVLSGASLMVLRRWGVHATVRLFLFSCTAIFLVQALLVSGVRTPILLGLPPILMLAGWFLGRRESYVLGAIAVAGVAALSLLEVRGWLVPQPRETLDYWWLMLVVLPVSTVIGVYAHGRFLEQLARAQHGSARLEEELAARQRSEARMRATLEHTANVAIQWYDRDGRVLYWNHASEQMYGWSSEEAVGRRIGDLLLDADAAQAFVESMRGLDARDGCLGPTEHRVTRKDGDFRWVSAALFAIPGEDGQPCFVCMDVDITERRRAENALRARNESLRMINELSSRVYAMRDVESILRGTIDAVIAVTRAAKMVTYQFEPDGVHLRLLASHGLDDEYDRIASRVDIRQSWTGRAMKLGRPLVARDIATERRFAPAIRRALAARGLGSGVVIPLFDRDTPQGCVALFYPPGALDGCGQEEMETFEAVSRTLSMAIANARHLGHLRHQARHDALTGLPNRTALHEAFERLAPTLETGPRPAVMLLDLDRFKEINDTLGHHIGDRLLGALSRRLAATVGSDGALTCRLGGDEFALLLEDAGSADRALLRARAIREALAQPFELDGMSLKVGASIGVSLYPEHGCTTRR